MADSSESSDRETASDEADGTTDAAEWVGRVPFDSLPGARNPEQGFLASANQVPTGPDYPWRRRESSGRRDR